MHNSCIKLLMNASGIYKNINFEASLDSLLGIPYLHMFIHKKLTWDGFLFEYMCLISFWKDLCKSSLIYPQKQVHNAWVHNVIKDCISHLRKHNLCEALLEFPVRHSIFTYVYSQEINLRWLLVWVHVPWFLEKAYVKVKYFICTNRYIMNA